MFKEISEAYDVLSDEKKRKIFDKYGRDGLKANNGAGGRARSGSHAGPHHHHHHRFGATFEDEEEDIFTSFGFRDPFDIFREFFGAADPFEDFMDPFGGFGMMGGMARNRQTGFGGGNSLVMRHNNRRGQFPMSSAMSPFGAFGGFGFGLPGFGMGFGGFGGAGGFGGFDELDNAGGFTSVQTFSSAGGPGMVAMRSSSTSSRWAPFISFLHY